MAVEEIGRLRTIAIVGQGGTGKTQGGRRDALHFRRVAKVWESPTRARPRWTSSPKKTSITFRSVPRSIISTGKKTDSNFRRHARLHRVSAGDAHDSARG